MDSFFDRHISFTLFMPKSFEIVHTCVYNQNNEAHEALSWQHQIFDICKLYLFPHIYDPFSIPCLAVIYLLFANAYEVFTAILNISHWNCPHLCI